MKKSIKSFQLLLVAILILSVLAACSSNNTNNSGNKNNSGNNSTSTAVPNEDASAEDTELKHYNLTMAVPVFGAVPADLQIVQDEINKITEQKINTTITILPVSIGTWGQQLNLMMSGGEKLDLAYMFAQMYSGAAATGQLHPLNDLLASHGQGAVDAVGADYMKVASIDGETYGVPITGAYATASGIAMRKDLVEKYNIDVSSIKTLEDLEPIFQLIKDNEPGMSPLASGLTSPLEYHRSFDRLGDRLGVLPDYDNNFQVVNWFESEEYAEQVGLMHRWFKAGYINKDAATSQTTVEEIMKADKAFSFLSVHKPDIPAGLTRNVGKEIVLIPLSPAYSTTADAMVGLWSVAHHSENPERAMMFLDLLYTDPEITNLLMWGIEGKHYVKVSDTQVNYPEGLDSTTVAYSFNAMFVGNPMNGYTFHTDDPNLWEQVKEFNASAIRSAAFGFSFNAAPVENERTAINNVIEQYRKVLETGSVDPASKLAEFNTKLKAAGMDKFIAEKQKQLDEWAAANK